MQWVLGGAHTAVIEVELMLWSLKAKPVEDSVRGGPNGVGSGILDAPNPAVRGGKPGLELGKLPAKVSSSV
jgi:hypothetical protein